MIGGCGVELTTRAMTVAWPVAVIWRCDMPKDPKDLGDQILARFRAAGIEVPPPDGGAANAESVRAMMAEADDASTRSDDERATASVTAGAYPRV